MLDLHRLRLLRELAHRKTIAATARALGYSPSAVSQQLATLERETGASLLDRAAHRVELTQAGRQLAEHAERILDLVAAAETELRADDGNPTGQVTIGAFPTAAVAFAPALAHDLRKYPALTLVLRQMNHELGLSQVLTGDIDVALVDDWNNSLASDHRTGLRFHHLLHDPLVLVMAREHASADPAIPVDLKRLRTESWIAAPASEPSRQAVDRLLAHVGGAAPVQCEFEGLGTILSLVSAGIGIAAVPALTLAAGGYRVAVREIPGQPLIRNIYAVTRTSSLRRPSINVTLEALHDTARDLVEAAGRRIAGESES